jgi:hypothetical protein
MTDDRIYQKLLDRMLLIENVGSIIYESLASKAKDENIRLAYGRLALNEQETARHIENEILEISKNNPKQVNGLILNIAKLVCGILTVRQISYVLKIILHRRMYSKWYNIYNERNRDFWCLLLSHEQLQHELLRSFWGN